ncbi:helix-turn-helix transcriptional regulator, partial [bacterium]|nr:helix-turn-helix transcriptional regulator [bacterium]
MRKDCEILLSEIRKLPTDRLTPACGGSYPSFGHVRPLFVGYSRDDESSGRFFLDNSTRREFPGPPVCYFQYALDGWGGFRHGAREHRIEAGQGFLFRIPSDTAHWLPDGARWERLYVAFRGETALSIAEEILEHHGPVFNLRPDSEGVQLLAQMYREAVAEEKPTVFRAAGLLYRFLMALCETALLREPDYPAPILRVTRFIDNRYGDPDLRLEDLARQAGLSKYHFARLFRHTTGHTPAAWLRERRMKAAQELLAFTHLPPKQIALFA